MIPMERGPGLVFGVGEETQRRPPLVPKGRISRAARSTGGRVAGRVGFCSLVLIAGHLSVAACALRMCGTSVWCGVGGFRMCGTTASLGTQ